MKIQIFTILSALIVQNNIISSITQPHKSNSINDASFRLNQAINNNDTNRVKSLLRQTDPDLITIEIILNAAKPGHENSLKIFQELGFTKKKFNGVPCFLQACHNATRFSSSEYITILTNLMDHGADPFEAGILHYQANVSSITPTEYLHKRITACLGYPAMTCSQRIIDFCEQMIQLINSHAVAQAQGFYL